MNDWCVSPFVAKILEKKIIPKSEIIKYVKISYVYNKLLIIYSNI